MTGRSLEPTSRAEQAESERDALLARFRALLRAAHAEGHGALESAVQAAGETPEAVAVVLQRADDEVNLRVAEYAVISLENALDDLYLADDLNTGRRYVQERLTETRAAVNHYRVALHGACGAKASDVPSLAATHNTDTWIPCMLPTDHKEKFHWSSSGCAGGQVFWTDEGESHGV